MKDFKTESKRILDLMINSIYTHKEIFLRELLSNCSDAIDKLYYKGLTEGLTGLSREDFAIKIKTDKENKILTISDNGIGMTAEELENNLGTIAKSGSLDFKKNEKDEKAKDNINIIGQFGVGFYSAFMVSDKVEVISKAFGADKAYKWTSSGAEGYDMEESERDGNGTTVILYLKTDTDDEKYSEYLEEYQIRNLVKKYSDYIRYPIKMEVTKYREKKTEADKAYDKAKTEEAKADKTETSEETKTEDVKADKTETSEEAKADKTESSEEAKTEEVKADEAKTSEEVKTEDVKTEAGEKTEEKKTETETYKEEETLNSMIPLWKKQKSEIKKEEYDKFYTDMFSDYEAPLKVIHTSAEGAVDYKALLFIPAQMPYNYYSKNFEKGLRLYTNGVLITDRCEDLLPDYFSFVKGLVDSELSLNISRETIQHNRQLKLIESNLEKKIKSELLDMLKNDRETYEKFYKNFGLQLKYGIYSGWGMNKEMLQDLIMFKSAKTNKNVTLEEYVNAMTADQKFIYYGTGKTVDAVKALPQCEKVLDGGYDILCFTDDVDEFAIKMLNEFNGKQFRSIAAEDLGLNKSEDEKTYEGDKDMLSYIKDCLGDKVSKVKVSSVLKSHPVCLSQEGEVSLEMEKVLNNMPNNEGNNVKANKVLEINGNHAIYAKIKTLYETDKDKLKELSDVLFAEALQISGLAIENPTEIADKIFKLLAE